jgi:hypothetical protein
VTRSTKSLPKSCLAGEAVIILTPTIVVAQTSTTPTTLLNTYLLTVYVNIVCKCRLHKKYNLRLAKQSGNMLKEFETHKERVGSIVF